MQREDLEVLIRSRVPLVVVESRDEAQVLKALTRACTRQPSTTGAPLAAAVNSARSGLPLYQRSITDGLPFLTWLAEKKSRVFVVATANDIAALPPELIRKGRFDEIFFVDLPNLDTRIEILRIHAAKRGIALDPATLASLGRACEGFAGAEIEQAIVATLYSAHAQHVAPSATLLGTEIAATRPLAVVMAEKVAELRAWAADRTVGAD